MMEKGRTEYQKGGQKWGREEDPRGKTGKGKGKKQVPELEWKTRYEKGNQWELERNRIQEEEREKAQNESTEWWGQEAQRIRKEVQKSKDAEAKKREEQLRKKMKKE